MPFCRFLARIAFTLIFWTIFHRFWMKFERKNRWFFQAVLAFSHLAKTMRFAGYPAWGQCFYENAEIVKITYFFWEIDEKNDWKFDLPKKSKNNLPGVPKWTQNWWKLEREISKIPKIGEKSSFLTVRFFRLFLVILFSQFWWKKKYSGKLGGMRGGLGRVRVGTTRDPKNTHHGTG